MKKRDYGLYLEDMLNAINNIENYTKGLTFEAFAQDKRTRDAVMRNLEIIGEASKQMPGEIRAKYQEIPWKSMVGMRDILIHRYFDVALDTAWKTVNERLPNLKSSVEKALRELDRNSD